MKQYEYIPKAVHGKNGFDLSYDGVLSQEFGDLVPIVCKEMVPGDTFTCNASAFIRLAPLASPTYGRIHGYINYFFVPNRILCQGQLWEDFMRGGVTGNRNYTLPYINLQTMASHYAHSDMPSPMTPSQWRHARKLWTYLGLPDIEPYGQLALAAVQAGTVSTVPNFHLSALPFAAYNRIIGDYYFPWGVDETADAMAEQSLFYKLSAGAVPFDSSMTYDWFGVRKAAYKKDYLTTAQIRPQRGNSVYSGTTPAANVNNDPNSQIISSPSQTLGTSGYSLSAIGMRFASAFQKFLERNSVAGARYFEQILARFGVSIAAEKMQRSQYIGGSDFWIQVSDVTSTAQTDGASLGELAGKGVGLGKNGCSYTADDYGFFIAILHIMPESGVVQGIDRMWLRTDRVDYYTEELEQTGNRPIYNVEVTDYSLLFHPSWIKPSDSGVFGYIPQYAEYKFSRPLLAGDFRFNLLDGGSSSFGDLNSMHLYRLFDSQPALSAEWLTIRDDNEFLRIFQDMNTDFDHFWTNIQVQLFANRPMCGYTEASLAFTGDDKGNGGVNLPVYGLRL